MKYRQAVKEAHRRAITGEAYMVIRDDNNGLRAPHQDYYPISEEDYYDEYPDIDRSDCVYSTVEGAYS